MKRQAAKSREKGSSLVEFALVCMLFLTILFGIGGFGHALYVYHFLDHAAKTATRYAAVRGQYCGDDSSCIASNSASGTAGPTTQADVSAFVNSIVPPGIDATQVTTTVSWAGTSDPTVCGAAGNTPGCTVTVNVSYSFHLLFPLTQSAALPLSSSSEMIIAH